MNFNIFISRSVAFFVEIVTLSVSKNYAIVKSGSGVIYSTSRILAPSEKNLQFANHSITDQIKANQVEIMSFRISTIFKLFNLLAQMKLLHNLHMGNTTL